ncbi:hypothetical protein HMPREF3214_01454 [Alloscardovia omnicolens]|nr:hypothetical protein HMPREF3214_01454 [Alloscardovia omnicolens]
MQVSQGGGKRHARCGSAGCWAVCAICVWVAAYRSSEAKLSGE